VWLQAAGSGIPEMKSILSGGMKHEEDRAYLSVRTLCAKVLGLVLALGGGLPLGKEGPFVHISCCLVMTLLNHTPLFGKMRRSKPLRMQMLAVGCAVGVSSTFGAPIGGVLFSIEVTAQYFLVKLYWKCFLAGIAGAICSRFLFSLVHFLRGDDIHHTNLTFQAMLHASDVNVDVVQARATHRTSSPIVTHHPSPLTTPTPHR